MRERLTESFKIGAMAFVLLLAAIISVGAVANTPNGSAGKAETIDDLFAEIARDVPAFGGMFFDEKDDGILYVYLSDPTQKEKAAAAIASVFGSKRPVSWSEIRVLQAQYGFSQLKDWYGYMHLAVLGLPDVVYTDIDEAGNRLVIGVQQGKAFDHVERELAKLGIPREAVIIKGTEPVTFATHTLRDRVRPVVGGLQIQRNADAATCTLGFNGLQLYQSFYGFATNSHCTNVQGGVENTVFYQPAIATDNRIGVE